MNLEIPTPPEIDIIGRESKCVYVDLYFSTKIMMKFRVHWVGQLSFSRETIIIINSL